MSNEKKKFEENDQSDQNGDDSGLELAKRTEFEKSDFKRPLKDNLVLSRFCNLHAPNLN